MNIKHFKIWYLKMSSLEANIYSLFILFQFVHWQNSQNSTIASTAFSFSLNLLFVIFPPANLLKLQSLRAQFTNDLLINKFNGLFSVLTWLDLSTAIKITDHLILLERLL